MGNSPSSTNIQDSTVEASVTQSNTVSNTASVSCTGVNAITNIQRGGPGAHQSIVVDGVTMHNETACNNVAKLVSVSSQTASQDLKQKLTQTATSAVKGINLLSSPSANNTVKAHMKASINNINSVSQNCSINALGFNSIFNSQTAGEGSVQEIEVTDIDLSNMASATQNCGTEASSAQAASQKLSQTVSQTATATTTGIELWEIALLILARGIVSIGGLWITLKVMGKVVKFVFLLVILILYGLYWKAWNNMSNMTPDELLREDSLFSFTSFKIYDKLTLKCNPDPCCHTRTNELSCTPAAEEIKYPDTGSGAGACKWEGGACIIKPGIPNYDPVNDKNIGVFLTQYSSVGSIDINASGNELLKKSAPTAAEIIQIRNQIAVLGLQNNNLYNTNAAKGSNAIITTTQYWTDKTMGEPKNPYEVGEFIKTDKSIYGFEWIDYYVDVTGEIFKIPGGPLTILYTNLPEYFWNWDLLGETKCKNCIVTATEDCRDCMGRVLQQSEQGQSSMVDISDSARNPDYSGFVNKTRIINYGRIGPPRTQPACCSDNSCSVTDKCFNMNDIYIRCPDETQSDISIHQVSDVSDGTVTWGESDMAYTDPSLGEVCDNPSGSTDAGVISSSITIGSYSEEVGGLGNSEQAPLTGSYINMYENNSLYFGPVASPSNTVTPTCKFTPYITDEGPPISVSKGPTIDLDLQANTGKWTAVGETSNIEYTCLASAGGGCVKEPLCKEFALAGKENSAGKKIDYFKKVTGDCVATALKDTITNTEWEACRTICEVAEATELSKSPDYWDGECIFNDSVRIQESILPEYPNTTGLKMFRDGSVMGTESDNSYLYQINMEFYGTTFITIIAVLVIGSSLFKSNDSSKDSSKDSSNDSSKPKS